LRYIVLIGINLNFFFLLWQTVSFEDIGEFSSITEYEDISEVNIFNKNEKSDKTLNEMGKVSSISKSVNVLSHGLKPSVSNYLNLF